MDDIRMINKHCYDEVSRNGIPTVWAGQRVNERIKSSIRLLEISNPIQLRILAVVMGISIMAEWDPMQ